MATPKDIFDANIAYTQSLHLAYLYLSDKKVAAVDISELLRAEWVLIVGAMDCYIHDIVCKHMHALVSSGSTTSELLPNGLANYKMPMASVKDLYDANSQAEKEALLMKYLRQTLHEYSFESGQTIEYAMSYIGVRKIWSQLAGRLHSDTETIKKKLALIVHRRNVIAHQSDIADYTKMEKQEIAPEDIDDAKKFIVEFVTAMDAEIVQQIATK